MRILISFGSPGYENALRGLESSAKPYFDKTIMYGEKDVIDLFNDSAGQKLLADKRGYGYWLWKPYLIAKTIEDYWDKDPVVMYCDSTIHFVATPEFHFIIAKNHGAVFFKQKYLQKNYTKGDCFHLMDATEDEYKNAPHLNAAFSIWTKSSHHMAMHWMDYCKRYDIVSDRQVDLHPNDPSFVSHRHDQSIISVLLSKYNKYCNYMIMDDISQFGPGKPILNHHRGL